MHKMSSFDETANGSGEGPGIMGGGGSNGLTAGDGLGGGASQPGVNEPPSDGDGRGF